MIGQASPSEIIRNALPDLSNTVPEIICLFVDPVHHRCGIGRALFLEIIIEIRRLGIDRYVLDCGYRSSQEFWRRILGKPSMTLKDHWAIGYDHLIWSLEL